MNGIWDSAFGCHGCYATAFWCLTVTELVGTIYVTCRRRMRLGLVVQLLVRAELSNHLDALRPACSSRITRTDHQATNRDHV